MAPRLIEKAGALDARLFDALVDARPPDAERAIALVANIGRGGAVWLVAAIGARAAGHRVSVVRCTTLTAAVYASSLGIARLLGRPRPFERREVRTLVTRPTGPSLPSDQVAAAFAGARLLSDQLPRAAPFLSATAASIAVARVLAGVHYPGDVLAAAALGTAVAAAGRARRR